MDKELDDDLDVEEIEEQPEPPKQEEPDEDRLALEEEARKYGWRPKEEFDRDPDNWVDAERFLSMPRTQTKIWRDRSRENEKAARELEQRMARMEGMQRIALEKALEAQRQQYEARISQIEAAKRQAVEMGDTEAYDRWTQEQANLRPPSTPQAPQQGQDAPPEVLQYAATDEGKWINDPAARRYAAELINEDRKAMLLPPLKQVKWAEERIRGVFPEYFKEQQAEAPRAPRVDGGGLGGGFKRGKSGADLPPEAKKHGQEFVELGVYKSLDEYAKDYFEQGA